MGSTVIRAILINDTTRVRIERAPVIGSALVGCLQVVDRFGGQAPAGLPGRPNPAPPGPAGGCADSAWMTSVGCGRPYCSRSLLNDFARTLGSPRTPALENHLFKKRFTGRLRLRADCARQLLS